MKLELQARPHRRGAPPVHIVRLRLGHDTEAALFDLSNRYASILGRPVSRSVVIRRAVSAWLDRIRTLDPEEVPGEVAAILKAAKVNTDGRK